MKLRAYFAVLFLWAPIAICAEDTPQNYDVELLVFRLARPTATPENWAIEGTVNRPTNASAGDAEEPTTPPAPVATTQDSNVAIESSFAPLANTQFKLNSVEEILRKSRSYLPVAHFGWTQPGLPIDHAALFSLQSFLPGFLPDNIVLSGQASLARGRYLHLFLDMTYQTADGQRYLIREQRRMRSNEKHYFDHPYFGVIALITPRTN